VRNRLTSTERSLEQLEEGVFQACKGTRLTEYGPESHLEGWLLTNTGQSVVGQALLDYSILNGEVGIAGVDAQHTQAS